MKLARQIGQILFVHSFRPLWISILLCAMQARAEEFGQSLEGDIGLGGYFTHSIIRGNNDKLSVLPYLDFDYGRMFARVDTLGIKTVKLGYGYLELAGRLSQDGFSTNTSGLQGLNARATPIPLGIGTFQITPAGAFMVNAFHDVNQSKGNLYEVVYGGELDLPRVTFYPLAGSEYQSADYVRYYYGISAGEAANSKYAAYQPAGSLDNFLGLIADIRLSGEYHLNCQVRHKWLDDSIRHSPVVNQGYLDTGYLSFSYRFK